MIDALHSISARPVGPVAGVAPAGGPPAFPGLGDYGRPAEGRPDAATAADGRPQAGAGAADRSAVARDGGDGATGDSLRLSPEAQAQLRELRQRDAEVRAHEKAHMAAGGQFVTGGPGYEYQQGPDGRQYAIGGHVSIDASSIPDDPEASAAKARQVRRAALAPGEPSAQDRAVAAKASAQEARAAREKQREGESVPAAGVEGAAAAGGATAPENGSAPERGAAPEDAAATEQPAPAWRASGNAATAEHSGHHHALMRAAETYAAMAQRGVMPTALAPGGTGISLQI